VDSLTSSAEVLAKMALDVEDIVVQPFEELIQRGNEAIANAEVAEGERYLSAQPMLRSARAIVKEGERALQKVRPLLASQLEKHGDAFRDAIRENSKLTKLNIAGRHECPTAQRLTAPQVPSFRVGDS
jgi:hypothetical protein